jgi:hypothetical protein
VLLMALLAAAAAVVCRQLALQLTSDAAVALVAWLAATGPPLFFYSFHLYTEAPSAPSRLALLLLTGPGGAVRSRRSRRRPSVAARQDRSAAAALSLVALARLRGRALVAFLLVAGAAAASFALYYWSVFGVASPLALYGGVPADARVLSWRSLAGLLLDRSFGLLPIAPVFLLALTGLPGLLRRRGAWPHLLVGLAAWRRLSGACGGEASARQPASWCRCCRSSSPLWLCGSPSPAAGSRAGGRGCS